MKTPYTNFDEVMQDLNTTYNEIQFKYHGHDYCILKIYANYVDEKGNYTSHWKTPCYMVMKSMKMINLVGVDQPGFDMDLKTNKIYYSWIDLFNKYKIDKKPLKDIFLSDEIDIYWWNY